MIITVYYLLEIKKSPCGAGFSDTAHRSASAHQLQPVVDECHLLRVAVVTGDKLFDALIQAFLYGGKIATRRNVNGHTTNKQANNRRTNRRTNKQASKQANKQDVTTRSLSPRRYRLNTTKYIFLPTLSPWEACFVVDPPTV